MGGGLAVIMNLFMMIPAHAHPPAHFRFTVGYRHGGTSSRGVTACAGLIEGVVRDSYASFSGRSAETAGFPAFAGIPAGRADRRGWRDGCSAAGMPAVGEGLAVHLELLRLPLDVDGSGEPGAGVPLLLNEQAGFAVADGGRILGGHRLPRQHRLSGGGPELVEGRGFGAPSHNQPRPISPRSSARSVGATSGSVTAGGIPHT